MTGPAHGGQPARVTEPEPRVLVPAGLPLLDAAGWVGASCRAELVLHERLTATLASGAGAERSGVLWEVRAHRAEVAECWHRRLPELREMPREGFVAAAARPDAEAGATGPLEPAELVRTLGDLLDRYRAHVAGAVGPADGPTADTLAHAIRRAEQDRAAVSALT